MSRSMPRCLQMRDGLGQGRQRLEAEEVELHEARLLHPFHVELGDRHVGARIAVERHEFGQRPVADDDAGGVRRGVAVEAFELQRDVEHAADTRVLLAGILEARLVLDRLRQRDRIGGVLRHELAELVDLPIGHFQHAPDVAHHAARLQRAEGDDLRDAVGAVFLLDVADHLVAPLLAEIDVEVRHRDALGIEEALEQQAEADRIEIGDGQRPGDERARARTAARTDRDVLVLRPFDEVGDDQEVARELHPLDDAELEVQPLGVVVLGQAGRPAMRREACREALARLPTQFGAPRRRRG